VATIHIEEIHRILRSRVEAELGPGATELPFLEIRFDKPGEPISDEVVDEELQNKVITANSHYGIATIQFDEQGQLRSIDFS
jgi:hypothetical protein